MLSFWPFPWPGKSEEPKIRRDLNPVLLIPGIGGSILHAETEDGKVERVWVELFRANYEFKKKMWSKYDPQTGRTENLDVKTRITVPQNRDGLYAVDVLDPDVFALNMVNYYHTMIVNMVDWGYEEGKTLFGFGYDFRQSNRFPEILELLKNRLKKINEKTGKKIDVITHSMGGLLIRSFLSLYHHEFSEYVDKWICIAAPFKGAPGFIIDSLLTGIEFVKGWTKDLFVSKWTLHQFVVECPSVYELMADYDHEWSELPTLKIFRSKGFNATSNKIKKKIKEEKEKEKQENGMNKKGKNGENENNENGTNKKKEKEKGEDERNGKKENGMNVKNEKKEKKGKKEQVINKNEAVEKNNKKENEKTENGSSLNRDSENCTMKNENLNKKNESQSKKVKKESHFIVDLYTKEKSILKVMRKALKKNSVTVDGVRIPLPFNEHILKFSNETKKIWRQTKLPDTVKFFNIYGTTLDTPHHISYGSEKNPLSKIDDILHCSAEYGCVEGDGTVPVESSMSDGFGDVTRIGVPGEHRALLSDERVLRMVQVFLGACDPDPMYDPCTDFVILPPVQECGHSASFDFSSDTCQSSDAWKVQTHQSLEVNSTVDQTKGSEVSVKVSREKVESNCDASVSAVKTGCGGLTDRTVRTVRTGRQGLTETVKSMDELQSALIT